MATEIGSLLIDMRADVARLAQDMAKAQNTVEGTMKNVQRSANAAVTALGLIGVGVSVAGMANVVKGAVGAMAALDDMAARAGTTVEKMSALVDVAKIGGHDLGTMEGAMVRLTKALAGGDEEAKGAGRALATLGLKADELRGMDTADAMLAVAKALAKFENGAGKTALMLDLLGKSGAAAIPYFEDLAEKGELVAKVTAQQAAEAERLEKDFGRLKVASDDTARSMANAMVPALVRFTEELIKGKEIAGGWLAAMWEFGVLLDPLKGVPQNLKETREQLEKLHAEMAKGMEQNLADGGQTDLSGTQNRIALLERRKKFLDFQQRQEVEAKYSGPQFLDARDLLARQKASLTGYESKDDKDKKKKKSNFDPDADFDAKFAAMNEKAKRANFDANDNAAKAEADAIEKLREKYVAMADPLQKYRVQLDEINMLREKGVLTADQALEAEWAVNEAMDKTIDKLSEVKDAGKDTFAELKSAIESWGNKAADVFADFVVDGKGSFSDLINSMLKDIVRLQAKSFLDPITKGASGFLSGGLGKLFEGMFNPAGAPIASQGFGMAGDAGSLLGFANGGDFTVGGAGGTDSQLVAFRATPGENVSVRTPGQGSDSGGVTVVQNLNFSVGVAQTVRAEVMNMMPQIQAAAQGGMMDARLRGGATRSAYRG